MRKSCILVCSILMVTLLGCDHHPITQELNQIDSLIAQEQIDSAKTILDSLKDVAKTAEDQAHYGLLATQLGYITQNPLPSDSLLEMAFTYYQKVGNRQKLADTYYYKSRGAEINNDYSQAIIFGKEAERLAMNTDDIRLQYKILESLAYLNGYSNNYHLQLQYGKKALALAQRAQKGNWLAYSYNILSSAFANLDQFDSALVYIEKSIPYIDEGYESDKSSFLMNIGVLYKDKDREKAKEFFKKSLAYEEQSLTYEHLADVYYAEGKKEEAYNTYKKALATESKYDKGNLLLSFISLDLERRHLDEIGENVDRLVAIKDSIINVLRNDTIKDLQVSYDHEVTMNAVNEELSRWQWYLVITAFVGLMITGLWLQKRHKMKAMLDKREIEIHHLLLQVDDRKNEVLKCENQIAQLKTEQQKDSQTMAEQESMIEELTSQKEEAQRDFLMLSEKMKEWTGDEVEKLRQGALLMTEIQENQSVKHWPAEKQEALIAYYCAIHTDLVKRINKSSKRLSNKQILYLILVEMGKSIESMSEIMGVEKDTLRSYKYQINQKEK